MAKKAKGPPTSYLNCKRPSLEDAMSAEGELNEDLTLEQALEILTEKGFFTPPPRPWKIAFRDRGMGHGDFAVVDKFGDVVAEVARENTAELIVNAVNAWELLIELKRS